MKDMIKFLEGMKMTIVGGVALAISLILMLSGIKVMVDPAWITVVICGIPLLYLAVTRLIFQRWVSSALLICIAMVACIFIGELFAAGEVAFIMAIGALLEEYTANRAKRGISKLISLTPEQGRRIIQRDDKETEETVPVSEIRKGDVLRVLPGERIAVDGEIIYGNTSVDQSIMTGESLPVDKKPGDSVFCGTMNCYGSVDIRATKVGEDSSLQKMINLVKEAENKKAPMQRIVDKWAAWLVPIALLIAVIAYFITGDLVRAVTVLVVFCPCALALATPVSIIAGIGQATKFGVLIKSGEALERMGKVDCITFDKTGTLTEGNLTVCNVISFVPDMDEDEILHWTASAESRSEHPLGKAIVKYLLEQKKELTDAENFRMYPGKGIEAVINGRQIFCGKSDFLNERGIVLDNRILFTLDALRNEGKAAVLTALDNTCIGLIALSDIIRPDAGKTIAELEGMGVNVVVLTGDNRLAADYLAGKIGIKNIRAELLPSEKVSAIVQLQQEGCNVCMIGDGVNDAPALKTADVGVAMGSMGSDIAIESADIALMGDEIAKIPYLKRLSNAVIRSIKVNISLSMAINFVAIALSVLGLLNPITGALVHNAGSVLVVLNAALLYDKKL
ncbi:heavy metal translocating P-type ATPase [Alistipes finegoldii]|uniref:heavy metal translocating P-type ATPase n=1 Tax=Alistipes finegoldii TaxID=214856 RepID=UPI003AB25E4B